MLNKNDKALIVCTICMAIGLIISEVITKGSITEVFTSTGLCLVLIVIWQVQLLISHRRKKATDSEEKAKR